MTDFIAHPTAGTATRRDVLRALHRHHVLVTLRYLADLCRDGDDEPPPGAPAVAVERRAA